MERIIKEVGPEAAFGHYMTEDFTFGGACGDRTRYLLLAKQALSQMS